MRQVPAPEQDRAARRRVDLRREELRPILLLEGTLAVTSFCLFVRPCYGKRLTQREFQDEKEEKTLFTFDRTFYQDSSQQEVFSYVALPVVQDALSAINGTVLAYGQTGAGKTHTMEGPNMLIDDPESSGILPRVAKEIFVRINADLYDVSKDNLVVKEDQTRGISIAGVTEIYVEGEKEMLQLLEVRCSLTFCIRSLDAHISLLTLFFQAAIKNRAVGATNMNQANVFGSSQVGKIYLVDLAGSEKVEKTGAEGRLLDEAKMINKSLSALGNVINALTSDKASHIPYRDSKLTRILQESLGGNSRTTLLCCCSPSTYNYAESVSTVRFGLRAKQIKNKPVANREVGRGELQRRLQDSELECELLRQHIQTLTLAIQRLPGGGEVLKDVGDPIGEKTSGSNCMKGSQMLAACIEGLHGLLSSEGMALASELPTIEDMSDIPKLLPAVVEKHLSSQSSEGNDEKDLKYLEEAMDDMAARLKKLEAKIAR
ncbi:unnamed protein product [Closterium sp. NIES-65]|nr:unnamed protein product [Closterium sp. NIES-65]